LRREKSLLFFFHQEINALARPLFVRVTSALPERFVGTVVLTD
jgi:hypothetical protein